MKDAGSAGSFATLTHARLRAAQGDVAGSARILKVILEVQPDHDEARTLLESLEGRGGEPARGARPGSPARMVARLSRWLETARRNRRRAGVR